MQLLEAGSSQTDWSLIVDAAQGDQQAAGNALERLMRRYWPAVYAYIRGTGRDVHEAADLTQGFVCDVLIIRQLFAGADPERGRFRTLLMSALKNYLREQRRQETRQIRSGKGPTKLLKLTDRDLAEVSGPPSGGSLTPEAAFCYQWSAAVVRSVLDTVRDECLADGLDAHWVLFEHRVVRPLLLGEPPVDYEELVERLGLKDVSQAANMTVTVKRRFVSAVCVEVGRTVRDPAQVPDELHHLLRDLERPS